MTTNLTIETQLEITISVEVEAESTSPPSHHDPGEEGYFYINRLTNNSIELPKSLYYFYKSEIDEAVEDRLEELRVDKAVDNIDQTYDSVRDGDLTLNTTLTKDDKEDTS